MKGLESYILMVSGFNDLSSSKKIVFFAYLLLIEQKASRFNTSNNILF